MFIRLPAHTQACARPLYSIEPLVCTSVYSVACCAGDTLYVGTFLAPIPGKRGVRAPGKPRTRPLLPLPWFSAPREFFSAALVWLLGSQGFSDVSCERGYGIISAGTGGDDAGRTDGSRGTWERFPAETIIRKY